MAEAIICDVCTIACKPADAMHIRLHKLLSATQYKTASTKYYDVCSSCYEKLNNFLGGKADVVPRNIKAAD